MGLQNFHLQCENGNNCKFSIIFYSRRQMRSRLGNFIISLYLGTFDVELHDREQLPEHLIKEQLTKG